MLRQWRSVVQPLQEGPHPKRSAASTATTYAAEFVRKMAQIGGSSSWEAKAS